MVAPITGIPCDVPVPKYTFNVIVLFTKIGLIIFH
jgi:hypothetical protein